MARSDGAGRRAGWVTTTYLAEGLPYMVVRYLAGVWLTDIGVREAYLGFLNFLGIPWSVKFLWAPAVDLLGSQRRWLLGTQAVLVLAIGLLAGLVAFAPQPVEATAIAVALGGLPIGWGLQAALALLAVSAFIAATHDVAIDGYYMEAIPDPEGQAAYTGLRVTAYRGAVIFVKSVLVAVAGWLAWSYAFLGAALALGALLVFHVRRLPGSAAASASAGGNSTGGARAVLAGWGRAFLSWLRQPRIVVVLVFATTYDLGDDVMLSMNTPFLLREVGVSKEQLAWLSGIVGTLGSIGGSLLAAWAIQRWGLRRVIWPLTLAMNLNIWVYVWLAWALPDPGTTSGITMIAAVHGYEHVAVGIGKAVLVIYLMRTCSAEFKAAHYAIASAVASLGGTLVGGFGGVMVEGVGYVWFYIIAFLAALPAMVLLPFVPLEGRGVGGPQR